MKIGFVGAGLMGRPMIIKLAKHGYDVNVYNRSNSKVDDLESKKIKVCSSVLEVSQKSDITILMLTDYSAIKSVLSPEVIKSLDTKILIQMSTVAPNENIELYTDLAEQGITFIEAPVLGSIPQIESETLITICSGVEGKFKEAQNIIKCFGNKIYFAGKIGSASTLKLALNQLIISLNTSFGLSLGYVMNNKVNVEMFMEILRTSALYSPTFDKKYTKMKEKDFSNPNFPLKHMLKDVGLIKESFESSDISIGQIEAIIGYLKKAMDDGFADYDYSAVYNSINPK